MKKAKSSALKKAKKAENSRRAQNNIVFINCVVVLYAFVLMLLYMMQRNSATIYGAVAAIRIFTIAGLAAAMITAAYSAYVSNKSLLKYSFMCVYIAVSSASLIYCNRNYIAYLINFAALAVALLFNVVYSCITEKYYAKKSVRIAFRTSVGAVYALIFLVLVLIFFKVI